MADKNTKLNVDLTATDHASGKLDKVEAKADALESDPVNVEVDADTAGFSAGIDGLAGKLGDLDGPIGDIGGNLGKLASPGGAVAALVGGFLAAGDAAADTAIEADNLSKLTGDSVEEASKLNTVWKQGGFEVTDLQDVLLQMQGVLSDDADLAASLGVNLNDGKGIGERFVEVVGKVGDQFDDAGERAVVMSKLFGEEGVRQVNSVVASVGDLGAAIDDQPALVSPEDVERAREYKRTVAQLQAQFQEFVLFIGQKVLPVLLGTGEAVGDVAGAVKDFDAKVDAILGKLGPFGDALKKIFVYSIPVVGQFKAMADSAGWLADKLGIGGDEAGFFTGKLEDLTPAIDAAAASLGLKIIAATADAEATEQATAAEEQHTKQLAAAYDALNKVREAQERETNARRAAADATFAARQAEADFATQVWNTTAIVNDATASTQAKQLATDQAVLSAADLADAEVRIAQETATANGYTLSGKAAQQAWAQSMIESASQLDGPMRESILAYVAQVTGIPEHKVTQVFADIDEPSVAEAEGLLADLARDRIAAVKVRLSGGTLTNDGGISFGGGYIAAAEGGIVRRPTLLVAGEAGPEAIVPLHRSPGNGPLPSNLGAGSPTGAPTTATFTDAQVQNLASAIAQAVLSATDSRVSAGFNSMAAKFNAGRRY
jgi:hypothetical protein